MKNLLTSLNLVVLTLVVCCVAYPLAILAFAQAVAPETANGSLIRNADGAIIGSRLIAQEFRSPKYFWPRPSAANYDASAAGGSNLSPNNPALTGRAKEIIENYGATIQSPLPADLVTASGGGLDPHISEKAAHYQMARVAAARGWPVEKVAAIVEAHTRSVGGRLAPEKIVPVLDLNFAMDGSE